MYVEKSDNQNASYMLYSEFTFSNDYQNNEILNWFHQELLIITYFDGEGKLKTALQVEPSTSKI